MEDPVKEVILPSLRRRVDPGLVSDMNEYHLSSPEGRLVKMARCGPSFKASLARVEEGERAARGVLVWRVPERHERGHRDVVRETIFCVHFDGLLVVSSPLSVGSG